MTNRAVIVDGRVDSAWRLASLRCEWHWVCPIPDLDAGNVLVVSAEPRSPTGNASAGKSEVGRRRHRRRTNVASLLQDAAAGPELLSGDPRREYSSGDAIADGSE